MSGFNRVSWLAGRQQELTRLWQHFEEATTGRLQVVLMAGEPGIGKTSLLNELAGRAERQGATILRGGASESEGMPAYLPFLEALGSYIRSAPHPRLRRHVGPTAAILATILPEVLLSLEEPPTIYPLPADQARLRLYEAVGALLASIARDAPVVLLLDDLQWADSASLDLLSYVVQHQSPARLLILGAYRTSDLEHNPALERLLLTLNRSRLLITLPLGVLSQEEIALLCARQLDAPVDPAVGQLLYAQSEGNPFFAEELLSAWQEAGALRRATHSWTFQGPLPAELPAGIVGVVRQRLARLAGETADVLRTAAILGRTFDLPLLAEVAGQEEVVVEERLIPAVQAGLLRALPPETFAFSHDKIRECLYAQVMPTRRKRLHGFIGHALERRGDKQGAQHLANLAFHFARSGDRERGASYSERAAWEALSTFAMQEALAHYRMTLELLAPQDHRCGAVLLQLGEIALLAGDEPAAIAAAEEARGWFEAHADPQSEARAAHLLGRARARLEEHAQARTALEAARALLSAAPGPELVEVLVDLATLLAVSLGQQVEGIAYSHQALTLASQLEDVHLQAIAHRTVGNLLMRSRGNALAEAILLLEQALAKALAVDDPAEAAECGACLTLAYYWSGQIQRSVEITRRRLIFAARCHEPYQTRHIYPWLSLLAMIQGDLDEAEHMLAEAAAVIAGLSSPEPHAFVEHGRGYLAYFRGDYPAAEQHFQQAVDLFRTLGAGMLPWYLGPLGLAQLAQGKRQAAMACLQEVEALLESQPEGAILVADALGDLVPVVVAHEDRERAARYYAKLLPFQGLHVDQLVDRLLGELQILLGDWAKARDHLSVAEATARREGLRHELAWTLAAQARLDLAQGGRGSAARARRLCEQALDLFEQVGMRGEASAIQAQLARLPGKSPGRQARPLPAGLSEREVEVLQLVVAGKSNHQIAQQLVLSEKTVANHLLHIFNKLGVENRAAAAAFAIRHGLA
jgi:ATP/maltotriose-dependent transcriptional regulator MalT